MNSLRFKYILTANMQYNWHAQEEYKSLAFALQEHYFQITHVANHPRRDFFFALKSLHF